jgi:hypothetical protein
MFLRCLLLVLSLALVSCDPMTKPQVELKQWDLLAPDQLPHWAPAGIPDEGRTSITANEAVLEPGGPLTGLRYGNWQESGLPVCDYVIHFEATRMDGSDFFAAVTFPVRSLDTCATLVIGGWGGGLVGISSIDGQDASENATRGEHRFENGKAYRFRLEVREDELKVWLDDRLVINTSIKGRTLSLRPGYIEKCAPFGLATYSTTGRIRDLKIESLKYPAPAR